MYRWIFVGLHTSEGKERKIRQGSQPNVYFATLAKSGDFGSASPALLLIGIARVGRVRGDDAKWWVTAVGK